ncbi:hypothetical protein [Diaphorobacter aerolatus]|uniref:Uncharacterized protein n=1 Tax=Diaphorobacter aerolatus TaxID=1288495 RepID=A0A7H0GJC3_9BURK|nr:hypothetical protein [Diaphorobacter aerolatus]QNP48389.1 hypothetical protein H9K75_20940 [Diaphorobacter aerolatus]
MNKQEFLYHIENDTADINDPIYKEFWTDVDCILAANENGNRLEVTTEFVAENLHNIPLVAAMIYADEEVIEHVPREIIASKQFLMDFAESTGDNFLEVIPFGDNHLDVQDFELMEAYLKFNPNNIQLCTKEQRMNTSFWIRYWQYWKVLPNELEEYMVSVPHELLTSPEAINTFEICGFPVSKVLNDSEQTSFPSIEEAKKLVEGKKNTLRFKYATYVMEQPEYIDWVLSSASLANPPLYMLCDKEFQKKAIEIRPDLYPKFYINDMNNEEYFLKYMEYLVKESEDFYSDPWGIANRIAERYDFPFNGERAHEFIPKLNARKLALSLEDNLSTKEVITNRFKI